MILLAWWPLDIPPGSYVNLGIGQPTRVGEFLDPDSGVILHTENGMLGMGPQAYGDNIDPELINAGKIPVTETPGAAYFDHVDSFAMMRGGHLDVCVLGAFQVSFDGDPANWHTGAPDAACARDGPRHRREAGLRADDAVQARRPPKLVPECTYPLTGVARQPCLHRLWSIRVD